MHLNVRIKKGRLHTKNQWIRQNQSQKYALNVNLYKIIILWSLIRKIGLTFHGKLQTISFYILSFLCSNIKTLGPRTFVLTH